MGLRSARARFKEAATEVLLKLALDARHFAALGRAAPPIGGVIGVSGPYDFLPLREADVQDMFGPPDIADFVKSRGCQAAFDAAEGIA